MKALLRMIKVAVLRGRLARISHEIEEIERFRATYDKHLDALLRAASNTRADIWYAENPRPAVGTTLRCLQGRR